LRRSGARSPARVRSEILAAFAERFAIAVETLTTAAESVFFPLPRALRETQEARREAARFRVAGEERRHRA
jgi:4-hydroxy-3-methylbut-2-enyl diphosphate reductase